MLTQTQIEKMAKAIVEEAYQTETLQDEYVKLSQAYLELYDDAFRTSLALTEACKLVWWCVDNDILGPKGIRSDDILNFICKTICPEDPERIGRQLDDLYGRTMRSNGNAPL